MKGDWPMEGFYCEHPAHIGGRHVANASDQYVTTVDIMQADGTKRLARISPRVAGTSGERNRGGLRTCGECAARLGAALRAGVATVDLAAGYVPTDQPALL